MKNALTILFLTIAVYSEGQSYLITQVANMVTATSKRFDLTPIISQDASFVLQSAINSIEKKGSTGGSSFSNLTLEADSTITLISDSSRWLPPNAYNVILGYQAQPGKILILSDENKITYRSTTDYKTH